MKLNINLILLKYKIPSENKIITRKNNPGPQEKDMCMLIIINNILIVLKYEIKYQYNYIKI